MQLALWIETVTEPAPRSRRKQLPAAATGAPQAACQAAPTPSSVLATDELGVRADRYVEQAHTDNTRRAYRHDWTAFEG